MLPPSCVRTYCVFPKAQLGLPGSHGSPHSKRRDLAGTGSLVSGASPLFLPLLGSSESFHWLARRGRRRRRQGRGEKEKNETRFTYEYGGLLLGVEPFIYLLLYFFHKIAGNLGQRRILGYLAALGKKDNSNNSSLFLLLFLRC